MRVSFTGTRKGMTEYQKKAVENWFLEHRNRLVSLVHGGAIGADTEVHRIARGVCGDFIFVAIFPAFGSCTDNFPDSDHTENPSPPLERNKNIVDSGPDLLLAVPGQMYEIRRSGTWATVRYARKRSVPVRFFWPETRATGV